MEEMMGIPMQPETKPEPVGKQKIEKQSVKESPFDYEPNFLKAAKASTKPDLFQKEKPAEKPKKTLIVKMPEPLQVANEVESHYTDI